jgi:hypothetical protein
MPTDNKGSQATTAPDKLRDGPCSEIYELLQKCRTSKGIRRDQVAISVCVSETDRLISCIHKNPAYFHAR